MCSCIPITSPQRQWSCSLINSCKCSYPLWADGSRWATGAEGSRVTHLHLRRASSLQTASYTFSLLDYPNFERLCRSDVKQISRIVANPVASPQPVVGIHFEVIIGEGLIVIPPCFSNSLSEPHIHPGCSTHTHTQRHTHTHTQTMSPNLAKFTQLWFQKLKFSGWPLQKLEVCRKWVSSGPPQFWSWHGDADDAGGKFSRSTSPERRCHLFFSSSALRTVVIIIPNQLLQRAQRVCVTLQRNAQVNPGGHDEHTNQKGNLSENATLQRPKPAFEKQLKAQMRHTRPHMHSSASEMSRQNKSGGSHAAHCRWTKRTPSASIPAVQWSCAHLSPVWAFEEALENCQRWCLAHRTRGKAPLLPKSSVGHRWVLAQPHSVPVGSICMQATRKKRISPLQSMEGNAAAAAAAAAPRVASSYNVSICSLSLSLALSLSHTHIYSVP